MRLLMPFFLHSIRSAPHTEELKKKQDAFVVRRQRSGHPNLSNMITYSSFCHESKNNIQYIGQIYATYYDTLFSVH